eukprot:bmy_05219T0
MPAQELRYEQVGTQVRGPMGEEEVGSPFPNSALKNTGKRPWGFPGDLTAEGTNKLGFYKGPAGSQVTLSSLGNQTRVLLEEQARHLLNERERATMAYYLEEYRGGSVSVEALVMALCELLNTHAKFLLLSEVRGTISPQDLDRFDHLVLRREIESMKARQPRGPVAGDTCSMVSCSDTGSSGDLSFWGNFYSSTSYPYHPKSPSSPKSPRPSWGDQEAATCSSWLWTQLQWRRCHASD